MGLDRLHRDEQLLGDLLVGVAAGDQPQHLALALGEPVQVLVDRRGVGGGERVQHETGEARRLSLDLDDLVIRGNPDLNLPLQPGDVVNIPIDRPVYVFVDGAVKNPGQVEGKASRPITLLQAVARAGGLTERANLRDVHVLRQDGSGGQQRIPVNLRDIRKGKTSDLILQEGDVVVVPETFF